MSLAKLMTQTGTILRAARVEGRYNAEVLSWDAPAEVDTACWVSGGSASEETGGRDALVRDRKLYLPAEADITGLDRFRLGDDVYLIDGPIVPAQRPGRGVHHLECAIKRVEG